MIKKYKFNNSEPVTQQIYYLLRKEIVECLIPPGDLLSEKEIAQRFGVSRQPIREALIKLAESGLVQVMPQRGTRVLKISAKRVADARIIREAVEIALIRRAAINITPESISHLEHNLQRQALAAQNNQVNEFLELDDEFHRLCMLIGDGSLAWQTIENIKATMDRVRYLSLAHISPPMSLIAEHNVIVLALKTGDADVAESALRKHLQGISFSISSIASENALWFETEG